MDWQRSPQALVELFDRVAPVGPDVTRRKMFGFPAAFVNGNLACGTFNELLMLRLPVDDRAELEGHGGRPFEPMAGRPMKGYMAIDPGDFPDEDVVREWLAKAAEYTRTLPPKK